MKYCTLCKEAAIYSTLLPQSARDVYFCPKHFAGLMIGKAFEHGGVEVHHAMRASHNLMDLITLQELGLWNEEIAATVELGPTLQNIQSAKSAKDIVGEQS